MPSGREALGATPSLEGAWTWSFLIDPEGTTGSTQTMCFYNDGTWNSPPWPWSGKWYQTGKAFKMFGGVVTTNEAFSTSGTVSKKNLKKTVSMNWFISGSIFGSTGTVTAVRVDSLTSGCMAPTTQAEPAAPGSDGSLGTTAR
jgi:hypothetical protein